jgi:hypothetical protein
VVESGMILKIVAFIFLAPLLGMALSMFVSLVTLVENTWFRVSLIILTSIFTWFLFLHLQEGKMEDNIASVMQVDVLHTQAQLDPSTTALYEQAQLKLDEATPLLALYPKIGASGVAKRIIHDVDPTLDEAKLTKAISKGRQFLDPLRNDGVRIDLHHRVRLRGEGENAQRLQHGQDVQAAAIALLAAVQRGPWRQRCAEGDGHHRGSADRQRGHLRFQGHAHLGAAWRATQRSVWAP